MAAIPKRQVSFSDVVSSSSGTRFQNNEESSSEESFYKLTTSEADSLGASSSDDEDASRLDLIIQGAYSCNSSYFSSVATEPAQRNLLLLLDKDLRDGDIGSSGIISTI